MIDPELLRSLGCPETHQPVSLADSGTLEKLNRNISAGQVRNRRGDTIKERIENGLIRKDGKVLYPIRNKMPLLLIEEAIPLGME